MQVTIAWNLAIGDDIRVMAMAALPCPEDRTVVACRAPLYLSGVLSSKSC